jgi:hypothetical protein
MMKAMNKDGADAPPRVELAINPRHVVIKRLAATHESAPKRAALVAEQLLDNSLLAAGLLDDPAKMVAASTKSWSRKQSPNGSFGERALPRYYAKFVRHESSPINPI